MIKPLNSGKRAVTATANARRAREMYASLCSLMKNKIKITHTARNPGISLTL